MGRIVFLSCDREDISQGLCMQFSATSILPLCTKRDFGKITVQYFYYSLTGWTSAPSYSCVQVPPGEQKGEFRVQECFFGSPPIKYNRVHMSIHPFTCKTHDCLPASRWWSVCVCVCVWGVEAFAGKTSKWVPVSVAPQPHAMTTFHGKPAIKKKKNV